MILRFTPFFLLAAALGAQPPKLPPDVRSVYDLAQAAPPEFNADALLRIVESDRLKDRPAKEDLIEQAFRLAAAAQFRLAMRVTPGNWTDSRQGLLSKAYSLKLDALSLECRAVKDMLALNPRKARRMFSDITMPAMPALNCDDVLVYDVSDYYTTLGAVVSAPGAFTEKERQKEEHLNFLLGYLARIASPLELAPAISSAATIALNDSQRQLVMTRLSGVLESMSADPRSFAAAGELQQRAADAGMSAAFEKYVQKNPSGAQCFSNSGKPDRYWQSDAAKRLLEDGKKLRFGGPTGVWSVAERGTTEWTERLNDYRKELAGWSASDESNDVDFFHEKAIVYELLFEIIPSGPSRDRVLEEYIAFLSSSNVQQQRPVEWFMQARAMLDRVRDVSSSETPKVLDAYQGSGRPVLILYTALERMFASKVPSWVTQGN